MALATTGAAVRDALGDDGLKLAKPRQGLRIDRQGFAQELAEGLSGADVGSQGG